MGNAQLDDRRDDPVNVQPARPPLEYLGVRPGDGVDILEHRYLCIEIRRDERHTCDQGGACRRAWILSLQYLRPLK